MRCTVLLSPEARRFPLVLQNTLIVTRLDVLRCQTSPGVDIPDLVDNQNRKMTSKAQIIPESVRETAKATAEVAVGAATRGVEMLREKTGSRAFAEKARKSPLSTLGLLLGLVAFAVTSSFVVGTIVLFSPFWIPVLLFVGTALVGIGVFRFAIQMLSKRVGQLGGSSKTM
jgi:hypothetical protein